MGKRTSILDPENVFPPPLVVPSAENQETALMWAKAREKRAAIFGRALFPNPVWDILLDVYISAGKRRSLTATDIAAGSGVPPTTLLRWLAVLEAMNLISRTKDANDRRRAIINLTELGLTKMEATFRATSDIAHRKPRG